MLLFLYYEHALRFLIFSVFSCLLLLSVSFSVYLFIYLFIYVLYVRTPPVAQATQAIWSALVISENKLERMRRQVVSKPLSIVSDPPQM